MEVAKEIASSLALGMLIFTVFMGIFAANGLKGSEVNSAAILAGFISVMAALTFFAAI